MSFTVDGLFSGLDTTAMINAIIGAQSGNRNAMQARSIAAQADGRGPIGLQQAPESLSDAAQTLRDLGDKGYTATVPETAGFTATTGSGAVPGTYNVVGDLARRPRRWRSPRDSASTARQH